MSSPADSKPQRRQNEPTPTTTASTDRTVRLNKVLADHGIASRRRCDELITDGKVMVDGQPVTRLGSRVDPSTQRIEVDGVVLRTEDARPRYYLLNKPAGVVCTNEEREQRRRAVDLITDRRKGRIYTVGRLDEATVGLVILTNDGDFAHRVMHPRYGVPKTYLVKVPGRVQDDALRKVREGVWLADGRTSGARIVVQKRSDRGSTLLVTLREGKNREVRRIFAKVGYSVKSLRRIRIGRLSDRGLKIGQWRPLLREEVRALLEGGDADEDERRGRGGRGRQSGGRGRQAGGRGRRTAQQQPRRGQGGRTSGAGRPAHRRSRNA